MSLQAKLQEEYYRTQIQLSQEILKEVKQIKVLLRTLKPSRPKKLRKRRSE